MPPYPLAWIWIHIITGLPTRLICNIWCKKRKASIVFFFIYFASGGYCPRTPLVKCDVFIFVLTCASGLNLEKSMAQNLGCCWFITLKIVVLYGDNNILWNIQNAPDRTIYIIFCLRGGGVGLGMPPAQVWIQIITGLPKRLVCNSPSRQRWWYTLVRFPGYRLASENERS